MKASDAFQLIPTCGCGDSDGVVRLTHWTLAMFAYKNEHAGDYYESPEHQFKTQVLGMDTAYDPLFWAFLAALDDKGLLDHGSTIRQSWLTELGEDLLRFFEHHGERVYGGFGAFDWSDDDSEASP